jgi:hypothetical protein
VTITAEDDRESFGERRILTLGLLDDPRVQVRQGILGLRSRRASDSIARRTVDAHTMSGSRRGTPPQFSTLTGDS